MQEVDERTLPIDIQERIKDLLECEANNNIDLDIYWSELYGSINSAQHSRDIKRNCRFFKR